MCQSKGPEAKIGEWEIPSGGTEGLDHGGRRSEKKKKTNSQIRERKIEENGAMKAFRKAKKDGGKSKLVIWKGPGVTKFSARGPRRKNGLCQATKKKGGRALSKTLRILKPRKRLEGLRGEKSYEFEC